MTLLELPTGTLRERCTPVLETERLVLRAPQLGDAKVIAKLANDRHIAENTARIPHPYDINDAKEYIAWAKETRAESAFLITLDDDVIGACGVGLDDANPEIGYWVGVRYWGQGYATEAAREMLRYGFEDLRLHRIFAYHFKHNPASGRILQKLGMRYEGRQREHFCKWDQFVDSDLYGILQHEWENRE